MKNEILLFGLGNLASSPFLSLFVQLPFVWILSSHVWMGFFLHSSLWGKPAFRIRKARHGVYSRVNHRSWVARETQFHRMLKQDHLLYLRRTTGYHVREEWTMQHPAEPLWVFQQHLAFCPGLRTNQDTFALPTAFHMPKATYRRTILQKHFTHCKSEPDIQTVGRGFSLSCFELEQRLERPWYSLLQGQCVGWCSCLSLGLGSDTNPSRAALFSMNCWDYHWFFNHLCGWYSSDVTIKTDICKLAECLLFTLNIVFQLNFTFYGDAFLKTRTKHKTPLFKWHILGRYGLRNLAVTHSVCGFYFVRLRGAMNLSCP